MAKMSLEDSVVAALLASVMRSDNLLHKPGSVDSLSQTTECIFERQVHSHGHRMKVNIFFQTFSGEAESLCAKLNAEGIVDAVISDDSDAFCYGAKVLLRNFSISTGNGACVEKYTIEKVDKSLKLDRNRLIVMAILLGCDFCPSGVPGVGKETVLQLFEGKV